MQLREIDDRWSVLSSLQKMVPDLLISVMTLLGSYLLLHVQINCFFPEFFREDTAFSRVWRSMALQKEFLNNFTSYYVAFPLNSVSKDD